MQKGGNKCSLRDAAGTLFLKSYLTKIIVAFRLVGYFTWNEEAVGSNPAYYTKNGLFI